MNRAPISSRQLMWAGFLGIFVWGSIAGLLGAILPGLRDRGGISLAQSGAIFVALSTGLVIGSLLGGFLLDRAGKKVVLCAAVLAVVVALVLLVPVHAFAGVLVLALLLGAGGSAVVTGAHALIADLNPQHRAASLNLLDVFFGVGAFVTPFAIVPLQARGGLPAVLLTLAALAALILAYLLRVRFPASGAHERFSIGQAVSLVRSPLFLVPALVIFLYVGTEQSIWDWQVTYFMRTLEMDNVAAARVLSIFPIAIMVGRLINNRLLMRLPPTPVLVGSTAGAVLCLFGAMTASSPAVGAGALLAGGLFMATIYPTTLGVVSGRFPAASGTAMGLAITCGWIGSVAISPTFGFVAQHSDFSTAYLVIVGAAVAMLAAAFTLHRQKPRSTPATQPARAAGLETS